MIEFVNFHLIPGLVLGSIYALGAIGVTLTFGILRFANFAHGETMTLGAYLTLTLVLLTGWHALLFLPVALALTALAVLGMDRLFFRPLRQAPTIILVIASFGLMLMVRSLIQVFWGTELQGFSKGIVLPWVLFDSLRIFPKHVVIVGSALALMLAVHVLLRHTRTGKAMRAMSDSPELARLTGIDTERVVRATWILGAGLAAAAGIFLAYDSHVETLMGFKMLLPVFASALLGGLGRPYGAMAGGLVIGMVEELSTYAWIGTEPLLPPATRRGSPSRSWSPSSSGGRAGCSGAGCSDGPADRSRERGHPARVDHGGSPAGPRAGSPRSREGPRGTPESYAEMIAPEGF